jgi:hypothetical protein
MQNFELKKKKIIIFFWKCQINIKYIANFTL